MDWRKFLLLIAIMSLAQLANAQSPKYKVGRTPTAEEISKWDISIGPDGKELPPGHGTAAEGAKLFREKQCVVCHGSKGSNGPAPTLIKSDGKTKSPYPCLVPCVNDTNLMSLHAQYATTMWDYINRAMPLNKEGTLKPDEVTAPWLWNGSTGHQSLRATHDSWPNWTFRELVFSRSLLCHSERSEESLIDLATKSNERFLTQIEVTHTRGSTRRPYKERFAHEALLCGLCSSSGAFAK
jgi:cytochrome c